MLTLCNLFSALRGREPLCIALFYTQEINSTTEECFMYSSMPERPMFLSYERKLELEHVR